MQMAATVACSSNTTCCSTFPSLPATPTHKISVSAKAKLLLNSDNRWPTLLISHSRTSSPVCSSSSASSTPTLDEEDKQVEETTASGDLPLQSKPSAVIQDFSARGCKACGREEIEKGCNGEGRIQGGIATVPGFGWWPIKAYRPCPGFVAAGGRYRRTGQNMDEIGFGGGPRAAPMETDSEAKSSKKKQGGRKSK